MATSAKALHTITPKMIILGDKPVRIVLPTKTRKRLSLVNI